MNIAFTVIGTKLTILLLLILIPGIFIGGTITLFSFLGEKLATVRREKTYEKNITNKKFKKVLWLKK